MRKLLLSSIALIALTGPVWASCGGQRQDSNGFVYDYCGNVIGYYNTSGSATCCAVSYSSGSTTISPDESTLASWAARKAVESQQDNWLEDKKISKLTREELDAAVARLTKLREWAKGLSNHIIADAYCNWIDARNAELATRRANLDKLDVALTLVKGLPTPPEGN
jgi:hypothetical protein